MLSRPQIVLLFIAAVSSSFAALAGCSGAPRLIEVRGRVTYAGEPLPRGTVSLRPQNPDTTQHQPTGMIDKDGSYRIYTNYQPGAPPGAYRVVVFATEPLVDTGKVSPGMPKSLIPARYNDPGSTPLEMEVKSGAASGTYDLQLAKDPPGGN